jgi:hypothetical protein
MDVWDAARGLGKQVLRLDRKASASPTPEPSVPAPLCELHPEWRPFRGIGPTPPRSECPYCRREQLAKGDPERPIVRVDHPNWPRGDERLEAAYVAYLDKLRAADVVIAGTSQEDSVLRRIAELREDEREHQVLNRKDGGSFAARRARQRAYWRKHAARFG